MLEDMDDNQEERNKGLKIHMTFDHTVSSLLDDKIISVAPALYNFLYSPSLKYPHSLQLLHNLQHLHSLQHPHSLQPGASAALD